MEILKMKCIVSLSGGRDSSTCLGLAVERYGKENVSAIGFEYGSKHPQELIAAQKIADYYGVPYKVINIDPSIFEGSTCTMLKGAEEEVEKGRSYEEILAEKAGKVSTYVPARNTLFSAYTLAFAESLSEKTKEKVVIMLGQHADDSGYYVDENGAEHLDDSKAAYPDAVRKGSKILMADGFEKNIEDVNIGDKIWSFNEHTKQLEIATVLNKIDKGRKVIYNAFNDLWVSENHIMWLAKRAADRRFAPYSSLKRKSASYSVPTIPYYHTQTVGEEEMYMRGYLHGFMDGDGWIATGNGNAHMCACQKDVTVLEELISLWQKIYTPGKSININSKPTPYDYEMRYVSLGGNEVVTKFNADYLMENVDFCMGYLNGIMISEGWCSYNKASGRNSFTFCQSLTKNPEVVERIESALSKVNFYPVTWIDKCDCKNYQFSNYLTFPLKYGAGKKDSLIDSICAHYTTIALKSEKMHTIKDAKSEEDFCYDLTTTSGSFIANGVLVHNCSVSFVNAFAKVAKISSVGNVIYDTPFVKMHKWELLKLGMELEKPVPYEMCFSCYDPVQNENGEWVECGVCATDIDVQKNMNKALDVIEKENPTLYEKVKKYRM